MCITCGRQQCMCLYTMNRWADSPGVPSMGLSCLAPLKFKVRKVGLSEPSLRGKYPGQLDCPSLGPVPSADLGWGSLMPDSEGTFGPDP